jgi:iron(III) transport system substrate-binding protein
MRRFCRILAFTCGALLLLGTGRSSHADSNKIVTVYTARHTPADDQLYQLFTKETGIKVVLVQSKAQELLQRIKLEDTNSDADVFFSSDATDLWHGADANLLQPIQSADILAEVPAKLRDPQNRWIAVSYRTRLFVYDTTRVKPNKVPDYESLADPRWQSQILTRSATTSDIQAWVAAMIDALGADAAEAWAKGMAQNFGHQPGGSDVEQITSMLAGNGTIAICSSDKVARLLATNQDATLRQQLAHVGILYPNQDNRGAHIDLAGAGLVAHAPHQANALKFLAFLVSPEAQHLFTDVNFEFPVRNDVPNNATVAAWGDLKTDDPRVAALVKNNTAAILMLSRVGWQ